MAFQTYAGLVHQWGQDEVTNSADRDGDDSEEVGVVADALDQADAIIKGEIGGATDEVDADTLATYAGWIAMYCLSTRPGSLTDIKKDRYDRAMKWLERVASGKAKPGDEDPGAGGNSARIRASAESREWTRSKQRGMW